MKLNLTMTGADEHTSVNDLILLAGQGVEIGLLYTHDPEGRKRYPSLGWIIGVSGILPGMCSLHVCGSRGRANLFDGKLDVMIEKFGRVQINGAVSPIDLHAFASRHPTKTIITQHMGLNGSLTDLPIRNHALLVDGSGGRGILPPAWTAPQTTKAVGFAGGLGADNLATEMPRIAAVASPGAWIDMEAKLRDDEDWFSMPRALEVLRAWQAFCEKELRPFDGPDKKGAK